MHKVKDAFTESEIRTAFVIGIATGHTINEITEKIISATSNSKRDEKAGKVIDGTSRLSIAIETLRNCGLVR